MDPIVQGALVQAGGSLLGGALGGQKQTVDYRGAKRGIRWRARDARLAGIHPLYAMGAPGVGAGQVLSESSTMGAGVADAAAAIGGIPQKKQQQAITQASLAEKAARTELLAAEKDHIQEQIEASKQARLAQAAKTAATGPGTAAAAAGVDMPFEIKTDRGYQQNPDTAIGIEEVLGTAASRLLHSRPAEWDLKEFFLGPWMRALDLVHEPPAPSGPGRGTSRGRNR